MYKRFIEYLKINPAKVQEIEKIPFLPIQFFKDYRIISVPPPYETVFYSSGTTGMIRSKHYVKSTALYKESFTRNFRQFYGDVKDYTILGLLPSYLEQGASSLVYMVDKLIEKTGNKNSGFYLHNHEELARQLQDLDNKGEKILLIGPVIPYGACGILGREKLYPVFRAWKIPTNLVHWENPGGH